MSLKENFEKLRRVIYADAGNYEDFLNICKPLEIYFSDLKRNEDEFCIVPNEPNFQLPNIFLKTKINSGCRKFIKDNSCNHDYSKTIDKILDNLESFDLLEENDDKKSTKVEKAKLEELLNNQFMNI